MNGVYIRELPAEDLAERMVPFLERDLPPDLVPVDWGYLQRIAPLLQERIKRLDEAAELTSYFFRAGEVFDADFNPGSLVQKGMDRESTLAALETALEDLTSADGFDHQQLQDLLGAAGERLSLRDDSSLAHCEWPPRAVMCPHRFSRRWKSSAKTEP